MAHFIVEYSANLPREQIDPQVLLGKLIEAAVQTGIFPQAGCRGRAYASEDFFVADGRAEFAFVHLQVRMGAGRSEQEKDHAQAVLADVLQAHLQPVFDSRGLAVSLELCELPEHKVNLNNIRNHLRE